MLIGLTLKNNQNPGGEDSIWIEAKVCNSVLVILKQILEAYQVSPELGANLLLIPKQNHIVLKIQPPLFDKSNWVFY